MCTNEFFEDCAILLCHIENGSSVICKEISLVQAIVGLLDYDLFVRIVQIDAILADQRCNIVDAFGNVLVDRFGFSASATTATAVIVTMNAGTMSLAF